MGELKTNIIDKQTTIDLHYTPKMVWNEMKKAIKFTINY